MKSLLNSGLKAKSVVSWEIGERQVQQPHGVEGAGMREEWRSRSN